MHTAMDLPEPVRKRQRRLVSELPERVQHAAAIVRLDENVDVFRVARYVRIMRERKRAADQKRNVRLLELAQRLDVELRSRVVNRSGSGGFHVLLRTPPRRWRDGLARYSQAPAPVRRRPPPAEAANVPAAFHPLLVRRSVLRRRGTAGDPRTFA